MNLSEMRALVRRDLHDEDPSSYRWSDAELDRHIQRAVRELSLSVPLESTALLTTAGGRDLSLAGLTGLISVEAVEYPVDLFPPSFVRFSMWGDTLTLLVEPAPASGEGVRVYYNALHTLDATTSTIPGHLEELVAAGAAGYAALEWASFAVDRVNVGGTEVWRHFFEWGKERLAQFHSALARLSARNRVRAYRLYTPVSSLPAGGRPGG